MSIQRILSGEAHAALNLGNPDSHSEIPFDRIAWRDLLSFARALTPPNAMLSSLTSLNLRNNNLGPRGTQVLTEALATSRTLTALRLAANDIMDEGAKHLAEMLDKNTCVLLELALTHNVISDEGADMLATALCKNTSLTLLDLSENFIQDPGAAALVCAMQANRKMRVLNLWGNRIRNFVIFNQLFRTNRTLAELNFSMNIRPDGVEIPHPPPNTHSLMRVITLLADNYASGLSFLSFDAASSFYYTNSDYRASNDEHRTLDTILRKNKTRAQRGGGDILDVAHELSHYDYSDGHERIIDWGNYALTHLELPDLGWGAGSIAITELYLDQNTLREFPMPLLELRNLRTLNLGSNELSALPSEISLLTNLVRLDVSSNKISVLPPSIGGLTSLKILDVRFNSLYALADEVCRLVHLEWLLVQQNNLTTIPSNIFRLTRLSSLDVQGNTIPSIKAMIYNAWVSRTTTLDLSGFELTVLPLEIGNLTLLSSLLLNDNYLTSLPPVVGNLTNLTVLDVRNNKLDSLAWQIGNLAKLETLRLEGNTLSQIPVEVRAKDLVAIKQYLKSLASGEEESFRMKLMLVGAENVGKTTTSRILREEMDTSASKKKVTPTMPNISTDGIDILTWEHEEEGYPPVTFGIWDFAGQEVYYSTHQFFLTMRSIYVIVFNMLASEETSRIEYWLQSVKFAAPNAPIIVIGTHADNPRCSPEYVQYLSEQLQRYFSRFRNVKGFFPVSCKTRKGFEGVRSTIISLARAQPPSVTRFPRSYLTLENLILAERRLRMPPVVSFTMFSDMAVQCGIQADGAKAVATFLNELGTIVWVDDPKLSAMVILDPQWLARLMATLITSKMNFVNNGILERKNLHFVWKPPEFPDSLHSNLVNLLEQFEILYRMPLAPGYGEESERYLLMCLVNDKRPPIEWPRPGVIGDNKPQVMRVYQLPFVPLGLMSKLITRILHIVSPSIYWKDGMVAEVDTNELLLEFLPLKNQINLHIVETVGKNADLAGTLRLLMENFNNLIEGYYKIKHEIFLCCPHCLTQRTPTPHLFPFEVVEHAAATGQSMLYCEAEGEKVAVHLSSIAPDLVLADLEHFRMDYKDIHDLTQLGQGAFGIVYKGEYKGELIAFKQINMAGAENPAELYAELRREVWLSSGLRHPCIVALKGVCFDPYGMAMEFVPYGNLYDWLRKEGSGGGKDIGWEMRLRIAMDLASGMRFLHNATPKIIHRDFKSPNVLMSLTADVTCKVSDFGASRAVAKCFGRNDLGNPSWLAPEVMKGDSYTEKADVFSYGIVLWELLTHEHPYAEHPISTDTFLTKFEQAIISGLRPTIPADCMPEFSVLISKCWDGEPSKRPSFDEVYFILCQIRRKLFPDFAVTEEERAVTALMMRATTHEMQQQQLHQQQQHGYNRASGNTLRSPVRSESVLNRKSGTYSTLSALSATNTGNVNNVISTKPNITTTSSTLTSTNPATSTYSLNTVPSAGSVTNTRGPRTNYTLRKDGTPQDGMGGSMTPPVIRLDGAGASSSSSGSGGSGVASGPGGAAAGGALAGSSLDAVISQFYFAKQLDPRLSPVLCLCHVPLTHEMWAGCQDGTISVYNVDNYQLVEEREGNHESITCMAFDNSANVWCGSSDSKIYIWDAKSGKRKKGISKHRGSVTCLVCSNTNKFMVSGSLDQDIRIWDTKTFAIIKKVPANLGPITSIVVQEEVLWVAAGQRVVTFGAKTFKLMKSHDAHKDKINCLVEVNNQVWSCSQDTTILVWSSETQEVLDELEYPHAIMSLLPSRNGQCLYGGSNNKSVVVWNTKTLKLVREQTRHDGAVTALAKGADNYIWSGSQDKTNCIWQEVDDPAALLVASGAGGGGANNNNNPSSSLSRGGAT